MHAIIATAAASKKLSAPSDAQSMPDTPAPTAQPAPKPKLEYSACP